MDEPYRPHPNLSDEINGAIAESELAGGAYINKLATGRKLMVKTANTLYTVERREDGLFISGNQKYCPEPTKCQIPGSTFGGSMLKMGFVGVGMYMEFVPEPLGRTVTTSEIKEVTEC